MYFVSVTIAQVLAQKAPKIFWLYFLTVLYLAFFYELRIGVAQVAGE
jgi:hypothetical protein